MSFIKKKSPSMFSSYIRNKTLSSNQKGYMIPLVFAPDSASESISASFDQQNIPGRSSPIISYSYTGARQVSISFFASPDNIPEGYSSLYDYLTAIKALEYPAYNNAGIVTSPNCQLVLPNITLDGVCTTVSIDYKTDRYTRNRDTSASVSLSFLEVCETIKGSINIITGGSAERVDVIESQVAPSNENKQGEFKLTGKGLSKDSALELTFSSSGSWNSSFDTYEDDLNSGYEVSPTDAKVNAVAEYDEDDSYQIGFASVSSGESIYSVLVSESKYGALKSGVKKDSYIIRIRYYARDKDNMVIGKNEYRYVKVKFK